MTSSSSLGPTKITLQFDLDRNIDGAARDVQAAINAARGYLPANLPANPSYRKVNPGDAPILIFALTSDTVNPGGLYDAGSTILAQQMSPVEGVGQVIVGGGSLPAVRVDVNPHALSRYGIGLEDVRTALTQTTVRRPKGSLVHGDRTWQIETDDQLTRAEQFRPVVIARTGDAVLRLSDVATVTDDVEDVRAAGFANGKPTALLILFRSPNANIIDTGDRVRAL